MSDLHTKLEEEVEKLKNKMANLEAEQQAFIEICQLPCKICKLNELKEEMDGINSVDDNRWDTMIQEIKSLSEDFIKLGNIIKDFFTPEDLEDDGLINTSLPLYPVHMSIPPPICVVCGTKMTMDIATLNKIDWYCLECCKKNPMSPLYEEKKRKRDWLRDYFFRH